MFPGASLDAKEQIRQAVDIVDLVGAYIELRPKGQLLVGHCPWHDDARPSLQVNQRRQSWKCWVCDIGGDIFSFVMQREGVEFREALEILAEMAGISLAPTAAAASSDSKQSLYRTLEWARQQFHRALLESPAAEATRRYLDDRGIDQSSIERFQIGFSPPDWKWLLGRAARASVSNEQLLACGLIGKSEKGSLYDRFKGRLIFPINDERGRPIAFGGRVLPGSDEHGAAKYVNSPETRLFSKSSNLYALDLVRAQTSRERRLVVVEGYTDVVIAHQFGMTDHVAVLGTALTARHISLMRRHADQVTLVLDGDQAGRRRASEILDLFVAADLDLRVLTLPAGADPCDFLLAHGAEAYRGLLEGAVDAVEHRIRAATEGVNLAADTHGASQALEEILATWSRAPVAGQAASASVKLREQQLLTRLSRSFGVEKSILVSRLRELRRATVRNDAHREAPAPRSVELTAWEREFWEIVAIRPDLIGDTLETSAREELASPASRSLWQVLESMRAAGEAVDFNAVLTRVDDPRLKNLWVAFDEQGRAKEDMALVDAETRFAGLIESARRRREDAALRRRAVALGQGEPDEQEQLALLLQLHHRNQERHTRGNSV